MGDLNNRRWQQYRTAVLPTLGDICGICGEPVNKTLPGTHRDGPTIDHKQPRSRGGATYDRTNLQLAHLRCNASKRNDQTDTPTSRDW